jgi:hypothetical protein
MLTTADGLRFRQRRKVRASLASVGSICVIKKSDRKTNGAPNPVTTEISWGLIAWSQVKSQAQKTHADFSHPWIVALAALLLLCAKIQMTSPQSSLYPYLQLARLL